MAEYNSPTPNLKITTHRRINDCSGLKNAVPMDTHSFGPNTVLPFSIRISPTNPVDTYCVLDSFIDIGHLLHAQVLLRKSW